MRATFGASRSVVGYLDGTPPVHPVRSTIARVRLWDLAGWGRGPRAHTLEQFDAGMTPSLTPSLRSGWRKRWQTRSDVGSGASAQIPGSPRGRRAPNRGDQVGVGVVDGEGEADGEALLLPPQTVAPKLVKSWSTVWLSVCSWLIAAS